MYCSSCGVAVTQNLSYCSYCGAKLNRSEGVDAASEVKPDLLLVAMVATFVFGTLAISVLIGVMKQVLDLPMAHVLGFMTFGFLLMLVLEGIFIRLLLRRRKHVDETRALSNEQVTNELDAARERLLSQPATSVTEHTTRAFEPIYSERKQR
jgi:hypothetical protein